MGRDRRALSRGYPVHPRVDDPESGKKGRASPGQPLHLRALPEGWTLNRSLGTVHDERARLAQPFGNLASRERHGLALGPMALRPRLTTGLPIRRCGEARRILVLNSTLVL